MSRVSVKLVLSLSKIGPSIHEEGLQARERVNVITNKYLNKLLNVIVTNGCGRTVLWIRLLGRGES